MVATADNSAVGDVEPVRPPDQDRLSLSSVVAAAVVLDLLLVCLAAWALARANGIALWPVREPVSGFCLALPVVIVIGAWIAQRFSFHHAFSFRSHLARTAAGGLSAALFTLALYLGLSGDDASLPSFIAGASLVLVCALHANYLGVVRSLTRSGILSRPAGAASE